MTESQKEMLRAEGMTMSNNVEINGRSMISVLSIMTHNGTHIDAPRHMMEKGFPVDQLPLAQVAKEGVLISLPNKGPNSSVSVKDILDSGVALGPDLPPFYTNDEALATDVARVARQENDPLWRMPLWPPYDSWLDSKVANINNAPSGGFAGSITCALFLQRFVEAAKSWLHVDIYGWTPSAKPARPEGGECQAARAIYKLLSERYG